MNKKVVLFLFSAIFFSLNVKSQINLNNGLAAHYPFDGNAQDASGNGNHGSLVGSPTLATDRWGNSNMCYNFNGTSDYIRVESDSAIEPKTAVSISAWVNADDFTSWNIVVCKRMQHATAPANSYILFASGSPNQNQNWAFGVGSSSTETMAIDPTVAQTQGWVHLVGTYDKTLNDSNIKIYVNGVLVKTADANYDIQYSDSALRIGMAIPGPSKQFFKGKIDEVRIYNRELNAQEVGAIYNHTNTSVNPANVKQFEIFPNPAKTELYFSGDFTTQHSIEIYDMLGKKVLCAQTEVGTSVNIAGLDNGLYNVRILNSEGIIIQSTKIVKE